MAWSSVVGTANGNARQLTPSAGCVSGSYTCVWTLTLSAASTSFTFKIILVNGGTVVWSPDPNRSITKVATVTNVYINFPSANIPSGSANVNLCTGYYLPGYTPPANNPAPVVAAAQAITCPPPQCYQSLVCVTPQTCPVISASTLNANPGYPYAPAGTACNDGNPNTVNDVCNAVGVCAGVIADPCLLNPTCSTPQCFQSSTCQTGVGCIGSTPNPQGTSCNNGNPAFINDQCDGQGNCMPGVSACTLVTCNTPAVCQTATGATCQWRTDLQTTQCIYPTSPKGTTCDDGNANTINDVCDGTGGCAGTLPVDLCLGVTCNGVGTCQTSTGTCTCNAA
jgi:hypothetical protein